LKGQSTQQNGGRLGRELATAAKFTGTGVGTPESATAGEEFVRESERSR